MTADSSGNVYVTGMFFGTVDFAADWPGTLADIRTSAGDRDVFVTKIENDGSYGWTKRMGGAGLDEGYAVSVGASDDLYVTGYFGGTVDFAADWDGTPPDSKAFAGGEDVFVTKVNSDGSYGWTRRMGGTGGDVGLGMATDRAGNVYVAGCFQGTVDFAADWPGGAADSKTTAGDYDIFVTKVRNDGGYGWTKRLGGAGNDKGRAIGVDHSGNVYVAGGFCRTSDFAADWHGAAADEKTSSAGSIDICVTKIRSNGGYAWTRRMGGEGWDAAYGLTVDARGNVYVTGKFRGRVDFAADWAEEAADRKTAAGDYDIFVTKVKSDGGYGWTRRVGGTSEDWGWGMASDAPGNVYMSGWFGGTVDFAEDWPGAPADTKTAAGSSDAYLMQIEGDGGYGWTKRMGGVGQDKSWGASDGRPGNVHVTGAFSEMVEFAADSASAGGDRKATAGGCDAFVCTVPGE